MDELMPMETRRRSRSKTPFLRSSCDNEACAHAGEEGHVHHKKSKSPALKKHPNIIAIIEESATEYHSPLKNQPQQPSVLPVATSDYSSNSSEDLTTDAALTAAAAGTSRSSENKTTTRTTTTTTKSFISKTMLSKNAIGNNSKNGVTINNSTSDYILGKTNEIYQNEMNAAFEHAKLQSSTPKFNQFFVRNKKFNLTGSSQINDEDLRNHRAYKEYKEAGEYWKKFPKTDYTYSKLSPHRREIIPGVVAMPNMSRKSLEKHHERLNFMIAQEPEKEEYIRKRYNYNESINRSANVNQLLYDSQDEVDVNEYDRIKKSHNYASNSPAGDYMYYEQTWISHILTWIVSMTSRVSRIFSYRNENANYLYQKQYEPQGFFARLKNAVVSAVMSVFTNLYMLISSVLYLDTWLLRSTSADNKNKKLFLLCLLVLLPLLLLAAWNFKEADEQQRILGNIKHFLPISYIVGIRELFSKNFKDLHLWPNFGIKNDLQNSLSSKDYDNLINHVNLYVQNLIDNKLEIERLRNAKKHDEMSNDLKMFIVNTVQENIFSLIPSNDDNDALKESDIEVIIQRVQNALHHSWRDRTEPITLSTENLDEITKLIRNNIEINNNNFNVFERLDINELLRRILSSTELINLIDSRIMNSVKLNGNDIINKQNLLIEQLNQEIVGIKSKLLQNSNENQNALDSIDLLKVGYNELTARLTQHELNTNKRFDEFLEILNEKIADLNKHQIALINEQLKLSLIEIFDYQGKNINELDLKNWIQNLFVAKDYLEERLQAFSMQNNEKLKNEIEQSGIIMMRSVSDKLKSEILKAIELKQTELNVNLNGKQTEMSEMQIKKIVKDVLAIYDADKTGLVDYALESAGGQVLSTRCTENFQTKSAQLSIFGVPLWYASNTPRTVISPAVQPGECWSFQGFPGFLVLKLNTVIYVSGFTLEHIPKSLTPSGKIDSAPRNFTVWGLERENDQNPVQFGDYEYQDNQSPLQYFPVQNSYINRPFDIIELRIESNHGNLAYTCLYRFRVHGKPAST